MAGRGVRYLKSSARWRVAAAVCVWKRGRVTWAMYHVNDRRCTFFVAHTHISHPPIPPARSLLSRCTRRSSSLRKKIAPQSFRLLARQLKKYREDSTSPRSSVPRGGISGNSEAGNRTCRFDRRSSRMGWEYKSTKHSLSVSFMTSTSAPCVQ